MYNALLSIVLDLNVAQPMHELKKNISLVEWIHSMTPALVDSSDFRYDLQTRCQWVLSGRFDFPACQFCNKQFGFNRNVVLRRGYSKWCSNKCRQSDPVVVAKTKATKLRNHGDENYCNREKAKQTFYNHFGVSNPNKCKDVRAKIEKTNLDNYGCKCASQAQVVKDKMHRTNIERRGVGSPLADPLVREKGKQTSREKYGTDFPAQACIVKEHIKQSFIEHYGVNNNMKSKEGFSTWQKSFYSKYGVDNPMKVLEFRQKARHRYLYNGIHFDSAPELAFYIWLKDNNIPFEYQPNCPLHYNDGFKDHMYFPDFKVGDMLFEIKGDHFFDSNGNLRCPYANGMSNEDVRQLQACYKAKYECMKANDVIVLRRHEYMMFLLYANQTYGKDFMKNHRLQLKHEEILCKS